MGSRSAQLMVKPRISACLFCRSIILALPSMEKDREMMSGDADWEEGAGVVITASTEAPNGYIWPTPTKRP